jgi:hypothetical protein
VGGLEGPGVKVGVPNKCYPCRCVGAVGEWGAGLKAEWSAPSARRVLAKGR